MAHPRIVAGAMAVTRHHADHGSYAARRVSLAPDTQSIQHEDPITTANRDFWYNILPKFYLAKTVDDLLNICLEAIKLIVKYEKKHEAMAWRKALVPHLSALVQNLNACGSEAKAKEFKAILLETAKEVKDSEHQKVYARTVRINWHGIDYAAEQLYKDEVKKDATEHKDEKRSGITLGHSTQSA